MKNINLGKKGQEEFKLTPQMIITLIIILALAIIIFMALRKPFEMMMP